LTEPGGSEALKVAANPPAGLLSSMKPLLFLAAAILGMASPPGTALIKKATTHTTTANGSRWTAASLRPAWVPELDKAVWKYQLNQRRYLAIEKMRANGMPAPIVSGIHARESTWNFAAHLHEGSPLTHRTRDVPSGRPLHPDPPYTFEQSAEDALYVLKHEDKVDWRNIDSALAAIEDYNGRGYRSKGLPSPYLWSGTNQYERGKFVRDHVYSPTAVDKQPGVAAILIRMRERGVTVPF